MLFLGCTSEIENNKQLELISETDKGFTIEYEEDIPTPDSSIVEHLTTECFAEANLLTDYEPINNNGDINAIIEIPSGTLDKWELNKTTGKVEWEHVNGVPRVVNYIGYPGNYGMIPRTLLSKENGGDGDPLDVIVLGPPAERGSVVKAKLIGVLYLVDRGEQDDKLIAVSSNSPLYSVNDIDELNQKYNGISDILQLWFTNYKGPGKMISKGFGSKVEAVNILGNSIIEYKASINE